MSHPQDLSLVAQAVAIRRGDLDPVELLDATLARIVERDGGPEGLNSIVDTFREHSRQMIADAPDGPLRGVPLALKDMFSLPWRALRNGSSVEVMAASASGPFRRVRDSGAIVIGIANQHLLGAGGTGLASAYGTHRNPWDPAHLPGGSSGGSAAAVSGHLVAGALGSDSGGSTRLPAAFCGVVGLKLTFRSIPYDGYVGAGTLLSAPGSFGRDVADARMLTAAILQRDLAQRDGAGLRVGIVDAFWDDLDPMVAAACDDAITATGWSRHRVAVPHAELGAAAMGALLFGAQPGPMPAALRRQFDPATAARTLATLALPAWAYGRADRLRTLWRRTFAAAFADVDVLAWPTIAAPAPRIDDPFATFTRRGRIHIDQANVALTVLGNITGVPGISVPVGLVRGLPVGLQLQGPWREEGLLLDAAARIEEQLGPLAPPPMAR